MKELQALLLGERVSEPKLMFPKGIFANTYHHWTGKDGDLTASPGNWSDYVYANAGKTYLTDDGAPRVSWTASITNGTTAVAEEDLSVLGLLIADGSTLELKMRALAWRVETKFASGRRGGLSSLAARSPPFAGWRSSLKGHSREAA